MKRVIHPGKKWWKNSHGYSLAELMVAVAIGGFIIAGVFAVMVQLFHVTAANSNYMAAFRQVQNSGDWISQDALMAQQVYEMKLATLTSDVDPGDDEIEVTSTAGLPESGVICIEDELIQYDGKTDTKFTVVTGSNATAHHDAGEDVTLFVALGWTDWSGNRNQVVYNRRDISEELVRSYLINGVLESSTIVAEAIDPVINSDWSYEDKELTVDISATVGEHILWKTGIWESTATRTYKVNPRPFF